MEMHGFEIPPSPRCSHKVRADARSVQAAGRGVGRDLESIGLGAAMKIMRKKKESFNEIGCYIADVDLPDIILFYS